MAEKKLERNYIIPLRKSINKTARWRRAKKSISTIRSFLKRHMKSDNIKIGKELNELIWERGGKKVPSKVNVFAVKEEDVIKVNLPGIQEKPKQEKPKDKQEEKKEEKPKEEKPKEEKPKEEKPKEEKPKEEKPKEEKPKEDKQEDKPKESKKEEKPKEEEEEK